MDIPKQHFVFTPGKTAEDFASFMQNAGDASHGKLVAKHNDQGKVCLFFKSNAKSSLSARITGKAAQRRRLARSELNDIFNQIATKANTPESTKALKTAVTALQNKLQPNDGSALRLADVKAIATGLAIFDKRAPAVSYISPTTVETAPTVKTKIEDAMPGMIATNRGGDASIPLKNGLTAQLPEIELNGKEYAPVRHLASGGFGEVYLYQNKIDANDKLAMKSHSPGDADPAAAKAAFENECVRHGEVTTAASGQPNILALKGAVRLADGGVGMLMEYAPGGSLSEFAERLKFNEGDGFGRTPPALADAIRSHMLAQTATGLATLHDKGFAHSDVKGENVFLDEKGVPKLADFGETTTQAKAEFSEMRQADNARFASYDLVYAKQSQLKPQYAASKSAFDDAAAERKDLVSALRQLGLSDTEAEDAARDLYSRVGTLAFDEKTQDMRRNGDFKPIDTKANDAWGLGVVATKLATGEELMPHIKGDGIPTLLNFKPGAALQRRDSWGVLPANALAAASNNRDFNDLIAKQFTQDAGKRLTAEDVATHRAANLPGSKEAAVHAFIPLQMEMAKLQQDFVAAVEGGRALVAPGGHIAEENLGKLAEFKQRRDQAAEAIGKLFPDFEAAKAEALQAINKARRVELEEEFDKYAQQNDKPASARQKVNFDELDKLEKFLDELEASKTAPAQGQKTQQSAQLTKSNNAIDELEELLAEFERLKPAPVQAQKSETSAEPAKKKVSFAETVEVSSGDGQPSWKEPMKS